MWVVPGSVYFPQRRGVRPGGCISYLHCWVPALASERRREKKKKILQDLGLVSGVAEALSNYDCHTSPLKADA